MTASLGLGKKNRLGNEITTLGLGNKTTTSIGLGNKITTSLGLSNTISTSLG